MTTHQINGIIIHTSFDYPPIPVRSFDWSAIDDDTYDGADDSNCPVGHGATEQDAIDDLLEQIEDAKAERTAAIMARFDATIAMVRYWVEGDRS